MNCMLCSHLEEGEGKVGDVHLARGILGGKLTGRRYSLICLISEGLGVQ